MKKAELLPGIEKAGSDLINGKSQPSKNLQTHNYSIGMTDNKFELIRQKNNPQKCRNNHHSDTTLLALLPENLREPFLTAVFKACPELASTDGNAIVYGNLCRESIVYDFISSLKTVDDLPDIVVSYDFNAFYHQGFMRKFLNSKYFDSVCVQTHPAYTSLSDFNDTFNIIGIDPWVIVADKEKLGYASLPGEWYELLNPALQNKIILGGGNDYFNHSVFLPYIRNFGLEAVNQLSDNILKEIHPCDIIKLIQDEVETGASLFIMPYSYASMIKGNLRYQLIWPDDGALAIPIQLIIKQGTCEKNRKLIDFLTGQRLGKSMEQCGYLSVHGEIAKAAPYLNLKWLGWDFISVSNLGKLQNFINQSLASK